ncbi:MAG: insulinase family protein [Ignavibacteriales bacterium]|nr:insulinase family protein [Ignavibacteriales bacterium]
MKNKNILMIVFIFLSISVFGQIDRTKQPTPGPAPEIKIGDYESFQLDNGLKVFVIEDNKQPTVGVYLIEDRDPILEGEYAGYVSIAGQLMMTGTKTRTKAQIDEEIDFIGGYLYTYPSGAYVYGLKKHSEKLFELLADVVLNPIFPQEELDKLKKQTLSGLAVQKNQPGYIVQNVRKVILYGKDHPYGEIQTEETITKITVDKCKEFYNTYFSPNISLVAIVGDITKDEAKDLMQKYFGNWQKRDVPKLDYKKVKAPLVRKVCIVDRPNSVQSSIRVCQPVDLLIGSEDVIKADVMNEILGGGLFSARLISNIREDKGFSYGAYSSLAADKLVGHFTASCETSNETTDSTITEFLTEMKRIRDEKVTDNELQTIKNFMNGSFARSLEQSETIANFALTIERYNLPKDYYKNYLKNLEAVTIDDVHQMANKYLNPNKVYVVVVGKAEEIADNLKQFSVSGKIDYYDIYGEKVDISLKPVPEGVTVETVLDKYINAIGGKEKMLSVEDVTIKMTAETQGMKITITNYSKIDNKALILVDIGGMGTIKTSFDGIAGKMSGMGQEKIFSGAELEYYNIKNRFDILFEYEKYGVKNELLGIENVSGVDAYKVVTTYPGDFKETVYFNCDTGLKIKEITSESEVKYDDYQEVNGIKYPHKISQQMGQMVIDLSVESVETNKGLDDSLFKVE